MTTGKTALFDQHEVLTERGVKYDRKVKKALRPILQHAAKRNVRLRDLLYVMSNALALECAFEITRQRLNDGDTPRKASKGKNL